MSGEKREQTEQYSCSDAEAAAALQAAAAGDEEREVQVVLVRRVIDLGAAHCEKCRQIQAKSQERM
jgi:hypothetical protein